MIQEGKFVSVHYTGKLSSGEVFDSSNGGNPFEFEVGGGNVIPEFEKQIVSMAQDQEKNFTIKAAEAYGEYNDEYLQKVPLEEIKSFLEPSEGMVIEVMMPDGEHHPARIKSVSDTEVTLDFNHPLAGQDLHFDVKLVGVNDEAQFAHECGCGGDCGDDCDCDEEGCSDENCGCGHSH
jgi:FKBP-type peptidyl-prolyl cis-trans isomerase 2